ncbi:unnamed protein product [Spirodela intermedia]|uniref:Uncharacterized protein n=1 Tax=Spirodela intermedia TaxID=51605 RepID=A0A7I8KBK7_SPIIN|nr:unnamed protein product [Spirodela intermedia]
MKLRKLLCLVVFLWFLAGTPEMASGEREGNPPATNTRRRALAGVKRGAAAPSLHLVRASKRRVRRGSDPIHNKC